MAPEARSCLNLLWRTLCSEDLSDRGGRSDLRRKPSHHHHQQLGPADTSAAALPQTRQGLKNSRSWESSTASLRSSSTLSHPSKPLTTSFRHPSPRSCRMLAGLLSVVFAIVWTATVAASGAPKMPPTSDVLIQYDYHCTATTSAGAEFQQH